jgi:hypothetical protein
MARPEKYITMRQRFHFDYGTVYFNTNDMIKIGDVIADIQNVPPVGAMNYYKQKLLDKFFKARETGNWHLILLPLIIRVTDYINGYRYFIRIRFRESVNPMDRNQFNLQL